MTALEFNTVLGIPFVCIVVMGDPLIMFQFVCLKEMDTKTTANFS